MGNSNEIIDISGIALALSAQPCVWKENCAPVSWDHQMCFLSLSSRLRRGQDGICAQSMEVQKNCLFLKYR